MKFFFLLLFCAFGLMGFSQTVRMPYQAIALDSLGKPMKNQSIQLRLSIQDSCATCAAVFSETHAATTDASGLLTLAVGGGTPLLSSLDSIDWANGKNKWLSIEIWKNNNYQMMGQAPLLFAPFSLYSKQAGEAKKGPKSSNNYIFSKGW
jgi:hypothetical protein